MHREIDIGLVLNNLTIVFAHPRGRHGLSRDSFVQRLQNDAFTCDYCRVFTREAVLETIAFVFPLKHFRNSIKHGLVLCIFFEINCAGWFRVWGLGNLLKLLRAIL